MAPLGSRRRPPGFGAVSPKRFARRRTLAQAADAFSAACL